jgi:HD-GYP domain-containing protein (c-di-GMP phosphodiesterase class II)
MVKGPEKLSQGRVHAKSANEQAKFSSIEGALPLSINNPAASQDPEALLQAGQLLNFKQDYDQSLECLDKAYRLCIQEKKFLGAIVALIDMAWIKYKRDAEDGPTKATRLFSEAEAMIQAHVHEPNINECRARLLHHRGLMQYRQGNFGEGLKLFKMARTFCAPDGLEAAKISDSLGIYYERTGDFQRAIQCLKLSLSIKKRLGIEHEQAISLQILGRIYITFEEHSLALSCLEESLTISHQLEDFKRVASINNELIKLFIFRGDATAARKLIAEAEKENVRHDFKVALGMTLLYKCFLLYAEQENDLCYTSIIEEILPIFKKFKSKKGYGIAYRLLGSVEYRRGDHNRAIECMSESIACFKEDNRVDELAKTHFELGKLYWAMDKKTHALSSMLESLKLAELNGLAYLTSYIEDEIYRIDLQKWQEIVQKRANYERVFEKEHTLLDALSALSEESEKNQASERTKSLISLLRVGQAMAGEQDLDKLLCLIKDETERALMADRCTVFLYDRERNELWSKVASGLEGTEEIRFPAHLGLAGYVAKTGEILNIKDAYNDPRFNKAVDKKTGYKTENLLCIPMRNRKMEIIGVFQVLNKSNGYFKKADEDLLMAISASAGVAIENAQLAREQKVAFESFIKTLSSTIDARDPITAGHSERVAQYSLLIGDQMNMPDDDLEALNYASLLHDIGKIGIKEEILIKDGRLTEKEYRHIQKHAYYTYEILKNIHFERHLLTVPEIAASHHEKVDGTGYFRGLSGTEIPLSGRILALSDVFDAITSRRHYRNRMPFDKVLGILRRDAGNHFDPDCVEMFFNIQLQKLGQILIMERQVDLPDEGSSLLTEVDRHVTLREYEQVLSKEKMTKGEADVHRAFSTLYHHSNISYLD